MKPRIVITLVIVALIAFGLLKDKAIIPQKKSFHELSIGEQEAIKAGCWNDWMRVEGQVEWRSEQAHLYRRWDAVKRYDEMLSKLEDIRQLLGDNRSDPTVLWDDIHKIDNWLKTGQ